MVIRAAASTVLAMLNYAWHITQVRFFRMNVFWFVINRCVAAQQTLQVCRQALVRLIYIFHDSARALLSVEKNVAFCAGKS